MALPREAHGDRSPFERRGRQGVIVQHPAAEARGEHHALSPDAVGVLESKAREEARLEGVRLAAREMAHLLNNDLAVAVGLVDLLQAREDLPPHLMDILEGAANSLTAAARHIEQMQRVVRVVVKDTPAGVSLDLERSRH